MKPISKRLFSLLLAVIVVLGLPFTAMAATEPDSSQASGDLPLEWQIISDNLPDPIPGYDPHDPDNPYPYGVPVDTFYPIEEIDPYAVAPAALDQSYIPEEMRDNAILRALEYTGYDVQYLKKNGYLYVRQYIGSSLKTNAPQVLSDIGYWSTGACPNGDETVADSSTVTGRAPKLSYFESNGLVCAFFVTYYLCNYLPNIEGVDTSAIYEKAKEMGADTSNSNLYYLTTVTTWKRTLDALASESGSGVTKYWENDPNPSKTVTVKAGETAKVTFTNKYLGRAQIIKTATNGGTVAGWHFEVKDSSGTVIGNYVTGDTGIITMSLEPGTYTVTETDGEVEYWEKDSNPTRTVTVKAGQMAKVTFTNKWVGRAKIVKKATNGGTVAGWGSTIKKPDGTLVGKYTTGADGVILTNLEPGTYTVQENPVDDPYWVCDDSVKTITVKAGETASVSFQNRYIGMAKIIKTLEDPTSGTVEGWSFEIKASNGTVIGTYKTDACGTILCELEPGQYTMTELLDRDSYWECAGPLSQTVTVKAGQTAKVTFTNRLKPAEIIAYKINVLGAPLPGAEFLLEWSQDGQIWKPVTYRASGNVTKGTCASRGLMDGKLESGRDGVVHFTGLHPQLQYRLTETKAPEGYQLLEKPVYEGGISPGEKLIVERTVVNALVFELPMTGSTGSTTATILQLAGAVTLLAMLLYLVKKRR